MIYLNYAKAIANGYILNFFADSEKDLEEVSNGKHFVTKNGTDYGVPQPSSTVVITMPNKTKKTYMMDNSGEWVEDPGISSFFNPMPEVRCGVPQFDTTLVLQDEYMFGMEWNETLGFAVPVSLEPSDLTTWGYSPNEPSVVPKAGELYLFILSDVNPEGSLLAYPTINPCPRIIDAYICKVLRLDGERESWIYLVNYDSLNSVEEIDEIITSKYSGNKPAFDYSTTKFILPLGVGKTEGEEYAMVITDSGFFVKNKNCHSQAMQVIRIK